MFDFPSIISSIFLIDFLMVTAGIISLYFSYKFLGCMLNHYRFHSNSEKLRAEKYVKLSVVFAGLSVVLERVGQRIIDVDRSRRAVRLRELVGWGLI